MNECRTISRRTLVKSGLGAIAAPTVLRVLPAEAQSQVIKIGHVSPKTGPLAGFGEADGFILDQVRAILAKGLENGARTYKVEIISKDSQSSGNRAAEVASELILGDKVNLIVASATPDTTNPVSDQAEVNEVPCITTNCPWQPYFFGRKGDPKKGFTWTYHFFWGLEDVIASFLALWDELPTNKVVGGLFPNDADGNAWGDPNLGLPPALAKAGYKLHDPGRYQLMNSDFTSQISAFKAAGADIVTGNMIPPDFATFWSQAAQQGFRPKIVTIGKALLFPSVIESLGERGNGLSSEIWWTPHHPFKSGLTGQSCQQLTDAYTKASNRPWTQPIGFQHALFEVAIDVLKRAKMMFLSYPNNPTSAIANEEYFDRAIAFARENDLLLIHDNAYSEIGYDGYVAPSFLERPGAKDVAIELFSCSKAYNMTGWRVAFACGNPTAIKALGTVKSNIDSGVFTAVQDAAIEAFNGPQSEIDELCAMYQRRRDLVIDALGNIGIEAATPKATIYIWAKVPDGYTSAEFATHMLETANVIVPAGSSYGPSGEGYVRISLTTPDDRLEEAVERIKNSL